MGDDGAATPEAETIDEIVADLREDPVLVHELFGNGDTEATDAALTELAEDVEAAGFPVYVMLVQRPGDELSDRPSDDLLRLVHARLEEPGIYIAAVQGDWPEADAFGLEIDGSALESLGRSAWERARAPLGEGVSVNPAGQAALTLATAAHRDGLSDQQVQDVLARGDFIVDYDPDADPIRDLRYREEDAGLPLVSGVVAAVTVFCVALVVLRKVRGSSRRRAVAKPRTSLPGIDSLRSRAEEPIQALRRDLETSTATAEPVDRAHLALAVAQDLAASSDLVDVVGAEVVALQGRAALRGGTYHPCFFNPLHGEGLAAARAGAQRGGVDVPACRACARHLGRHQEPEALALDPRGRTPYYEGDGVWARTGFGALTDSLWRDVQEARR